METLIKLSKSLVEHLLKEETIKLDKEYFFMFSVSKFILLKELLLKKGKVKISETEEVTVFYFDNDKNQKYISIILELYEYIKQHGTYKIKKDEFVSLTKLVPNKNKLACALWVMNKVRDSIAHGKYSFDFKNDEVIIDNEDPNGLYGLQCSIPLDLLNKVSFFVEEIKDSKEEELEMLIDYYRYLQRISEYYNIDLKIFMKNYILNLNDNLYNCNKITSNKYIEKIYYDNKIDYNFKSGYPRPKQESKSKYKNLTPEVIQKIISEMNLKELDSLIKLLIQHHPKNEKEKEIIHRILSEYKIIVAHKGQLEKQRDEYDKKTRKLIEEMHDILGIKNKNRILDTVPALYNYMCLSFSVEPKIDYSYLSTDGLNISFDANYQLIINSINKKCEEFNNSLDMLIKQYNNHPSQQFRHSLMDKIAEFYTDIISKYYIKNKTIATSIRNSIEHGNFSKEDNGNIKLVDLPNQQDRSTIKFTCDATVEALYNFTNQVNIHSLKEIYTLDNFFHELHKIIPEDLYNEVKEKLNSLSNIAFGKKLDTSKSIENMFYEGLTNVISTI